MEVQIDPKILSLVSTVEQDFSKAISEALQVWLEGKILVCPFTEDFCENINSSCNNCSLPKTHH